MLEAFGKKYHDNGGDRRESACCLCGREVKPVRFMVECVDGGGCFVRTTDDPAEVEAKREDQASYMGWFPVGPDCAKKLRKENVVVHEERAAEEEPRRSAPESMTEAHRAWEDSSCWGD